MKKLLLVALAAVGMAACVQNEELAVVKSDAIAFDNLYVNNATKADPSLTLATLEDFQVWGWMGSENGTVFTGDEVRKSGSAWTYQNTQYWVPEKNYYFEAVAPANGNWEALTSTSANLTGVKFTNVSGEQDLLYAEYSVTTPNKATLTNGAEKVKLQFGHLLSKVQFSFKNGFATNNVTVKVKDVTMTAPAEATVALNEKNWAGHNGELALAFGDVATLAANATGVAADQRLTIPAGAEQVYTVTFKVDVYYGAEQALVDQEITSTISGYALEVGKAYNFTAVVGPQVFDMQPIEFTVVGVDEWVNGGDVEAGYTVAADGSYVVSTEAGLQDIAEAINAGDLPADTDIVLNGDIDLAALATATRTVANNWTPIGTPEKPFTGTFNGNGKTIKNLALVETEAKEGKAHVGFFGYAKDATIKKVTFENVYINIACLDIDHSQGHIGAVVGTLEGTSVVEDVTVKGDVKVEATTTANGASRVAAVVGGNTYANVTIKNVHVIANAGSYVKANNNTGAIAGQLQGKTVYENCSSNIDVTVNKFYAGGIVGLAGTNDVFTNCHTTGNIAVVAGRENRHNDEYRVGGIAGGWSDGKKNVCTLINCSYTGNVSGKNSDGTVAEVLDYMGYVGRGYTLTNCAGSKVIINGTEFVQKYDNVYGVYTVNGLTQVATADELVAALEANEGVFFLNDIKIDPASMSNAYGTTGINVKNGQTIDGNGHTLNIKGAGGTWDSGINTTGGLIKNLTVTGSFRGIFVNHTSTHSEKVVLENVTIGGNGTVYTISCDQAMYQNLEAINCTFNGWTSYAATIGEIKFVNCTFGEGSGYAFCRPYAKSEFVNCEFKNAYAFDTSAYGAKPELAFKGCTYNGVAITAENATSLVNGEEVFFYNGLNNLTIE